MMSLPSVFVVGSFLSLGLVVGGCAASSNDEDAADSAGAQSVAATSLARAYRGTIGTRKVMVRLANVSGTLSGSYFYANDSRYPDGDVVTLLSGKASGARLTLSETVNGVKAGSLDLTLASGALTGTWKSPNGASSWPVKLDAIPSDGRLLVVDRAVRAPTSSPTNGCLASSGGYLELYGLESADAEKAINARLAPSLQRDPTGDCRGTGASSLVEMVTNVSRGFLTVRSTYGYEGGFKLGTVHVYDNFRLSDGADFTGKDLFGSNALPKLRELVMSAETDVSVADEIGNRWSFLRAVDDLQFGLGDNGLTVDLSVFWGSFENPQGTYPPVVEIPWKSVKPLLVANSPIAPLAQ